MQCDMSTDLHEYCFTYESVFDVRYILFYSMLVHVTCISTCYEGKVENQKRTLRVGVVLDIPLIFVNFGRPWPYKINK